MRRMRVLGALLLAVISSCTEIEELSLEEIAVLRDEGTGNTLGKTVDKPWRGEAFVPGRLGGAWRSVMNSDPKSFNHLVAEQDSATGAIVSSLTDYLVDYDHLKREWKPRCAAAELRVDEGAGTLEVIYTLRDDLYWSCYGQDRKVKVTSDDVIFWYDEIVGDPAFQSSGYNGQFLTMEDGSEDRIDIYRIDGRRFAFRFPRIVADPLLSTNMDFGPRYVYEKAKREGGVQGVLDLYSVATDPKLIPSMGKWFLAEYTAGQRLVFRRNPDYWNRDRNGLAIPYMEESIVRIIPEENTQKLLFQEGAVDSYGLRPEDLDEIAGGAGEAYTVFGAEGSLSASFWTFNQNPVRRDRPQYEWFTRREFRQAMSCLLNRDRIITQVYRGLAEPKLDFFPPPHPYYNPASTHRYLYDPERALELLASIGMRRDIFGTMRDEQRRPVKFDLTIRSESTINSDIASIIMADLANLGIRVNIRVIDFQKMVEQLFRTFEWDSMIMGLSGANVFPTQGSNVWPSSGNLHMWYPRQESPATEWEARIDHLYNEGAYTIDREQARVYWDEYQRIILDECPMISLVRPRSFTALLNRWDFSNVYFDNMRGFETDYIFLKP
jgi:peptide/nickel transport system substrate-binding protein